MRVLFIGNSITRHEPCPSINWFNDCGMAATELEKDYVHRCADMLKEHYDVEFMLRNIADWEREFAGFNYDSLKAERDFKADIVVMRISENLNQEYCAGNNFKAHYLKLIDFLAPDGAKVITTSSFWGYNQNLFSDSVVAEVSAERGYAFIDLNDLGEGRKYKAFPTEDFNPPYADNEGVCEHPNDLGMEEIARRIFLKVRELRK